MAIAVADRAGCAECSWAKDVFELVQEQRDGAAGVFALIENLENALQQKLLSCDYFEARRRADDVNNAWLRKHFFKVESGCRVEGLDAGDLPELAPEVFLFSNALVRGGFFDDFEHAGFAVFHCLSNERRSFAVFTAVEVDAGITGFTELQRDLQQLFNRDFPLARIERVAWREFSGQVE